MNLLDCAQLIQCQSKSMNRVIYQGCSCIQVPSRNIQSWHAQLPVQHALHDAVDHILDLWLVNIDHPEGCDVCSPILEVIKIDGVSIKAGEEEIVSLTDQTHLLALNQNLLQNHLLTVQHNQVGLRNENFLQDISVAILILDQLLHYQPELVHWAHSCCFLQYLLDCHH